MRKIFAILFAAALLPVLEACAPLLVAGVGTGALIAADRRKTGVFVEDQSIELKARQRFNEAIGNQAHINPTSYNMNLLLTGEAPTEALRARAEALAKEIPNVTRVYNEIRVAAPSSLGSRSADTVTTGKVKSRFVAERRFQANHVKIVTEGGVVYLMGIVHPQEAEEAVDIASTTAGVQKVVKLFEYADSGERASN